MTQLENLMIFYNRLDQGDSFKGVLRHMLPVLPDLKRMSIQQLAQTCFTSPSTITRLTKVLGYESFTEFRSAITLCISQYRFHNRVTDELCDTPQETKAILSKNLAELLAAYEQLDPEQLTPIIEAIHAARAVKIFAYGIHFMEATLQMDLIMSGKDCDIISGDPAQRDQAKALDAGDFVLVFCPDAIDSNATVAAVLEQAAARGCRICLLASSDHQSHFKLADWVLSFPGRHYMVDSFYLEYVLATMAMCYRARYLDNP